MLNHYADAFKMLFAIRHSVRQVQQHSIGLASTETWYLMPPEEFDMRIPQEMLKCVAFFGIEEGGENNQRLTYRGTGFFVAVESKIPGFHYTHLVTAKHVAKKLEGRPFTVRVNDAAGKAVELKVASAQWWDHPTDITADVAVSLIVPPKGVCDCSCISTKDFLDDREREKNGVGLGCEVFIMGLFSRHVGSSGNSPIVRFGTVAMMPQDLIPVSGFGGLGMEAYLIEARSIGGLSGSPVFVQSLPKGASHKVYFFGLMHGHWDIPPEAIRDIDEDSEGNRVSVNMGIAIVTPAKKVLEALNHEFLVKSRADVDATLQQQLY